jgi:prepilin-type N-terminal cleavage/methylation domain-containing protein
MQRGFTFIELILVVSLMLLLGTMGTAFTGRFFTQNAVENTTDQLIGDFRKAQMSAMMGQQNSNWGVNFASNTITLYKGNSFATRTAAFDEKFTVNGSISITGFTDLNFTGMTGLPNATPTVTISGTGSTDTITINSQGVATR